MKNDTSTVLLAHGSGGRMMHELISTIFKNNFSNPALNALDDAAAVTLAGSKRQIAFSTDSFVVHPLFFPGGDIGKLAVCGTVNDLAMKGARPFALSIAAIIEEGLPIDILKAVSKSVAMTAKAAGVSIVTGDTKVVEKGKADKLFLTTSGIGTIRPGVSLSGSLAKDGDTVIINGTIGDHGMAVLAARNDFKLSAKISSDCAPLNLLIDKMLEKCPGIHVLRDPTRGGLATTLNEIAEASQVGIIIKESSIPIRKEVRSVCNILGFDPLYVANEGKVVAILPQRFEKNILAVMKKDAFGKQATAIGKVVKAPKGVWIETSAGGLRPLIMLEGEQLPRIC
jgi:hydrogenase expression/formation protein HypE